MKYKRVMPRDLFNEAKLLKCLGQLALIIHERQRVAEKIKLVLEDESAGFQVGKDPSSGCIYANNIHLFDNAGTPIYLSSPLNCKLNYPLTFDYKDEHEFVFNDNGELSIEFQRAILEVER